MIFLFSLVVASCEYQPTINDWDCYKYNRINTLNLYIKTSAELHSYEEIIPHLNYRFYGREQLLYNIIQELTWRKDCWFVLDDIIRLDLSFEEKIEKINTLRDLLGPVLYYCREMPYPNG